MKNTIILVLLLCMVASPFGWPLDPDNVSHKTDRIYGCYNRDWDTVNETVSNFHPGIDLLPPVGTTFPPVHAIAGGVVTDIVSSTTGYVVVVEDDVNPGYYWCYQHLNEPFFSEEYVLEISEVVSTMYDQSSIDFTHLHLQRIDYDEWNEASLGWPGGIADPLNLLDPSNAGYWGFTELPGPSEHPWFYFLEDMPIDDWADWLSMEAAYADTLAADNLHGAVDIVKGFSVYCIGEYGTNPEEPLTDMPTRISWDCIKLNKTGYDIVFSKYPVDFSGEFGSTDDWLKYKQFYFRYGWEFFDSAIAACITNCNDNSTWNGIDNIEENCWNTVEASDGSGDSYHPKNMVTPDGVYFIRTTEYAWDSSIQQDVIECILSNTKEIAQEVHLTDEVTDQDVWHAEWVATYGTDGFTPVKSIYTNTTLQPGSTVDIEIIYSGPMSTTVTSSVRFTKPDEPDLTATPSTPEWTSTNQPDGYFDTWHGTVDVPVEGYSGWLTMKIKAKDISDIGLLDPSIADPDPPSGPGDDEYTDDHHGFGMAFNTEPQWTAVLHGGAIGSPCLGDLDGDGDLDVVIQGKGGWINCIDDDGTQFSGWPISGGYISAWHNTWSSVALADLDQNGSLEIIAAAPYGCRAYSLDGSYIDFVNFDYAHFSKASPAVGEVDGEGMLEVVVGRVENEFSNPQPSLFCLEDDLSEKWSKLYYGTLGDEMPYLATPAVGDISSTTGNEILIATAEDFWEAYPPRETDTGYPNWLKLLDGSGNPLWTSSDYNCGFWASPVVGDIDNDDINEIVIGSMTNWDDGMKVFILNGDSGVQEHFWDVGGWITHPAALADLDDNGNLDVIVSCNDGMVYAWSGVAPYDAIPGFPVVLSGVDNAGCPAVADIDSDFELEVVVGCGSGELYAFNSDGSLCSGFPLQVGTSLIGCPAIADIDGDCRLELIVADEGDSYMYCYDLGVNSFPAEMPWRQFQHDSWHTGCFEADNTIPAPPTSLQGAQNDGTVILDWVLSVNDFYSLQPEEPTDVVSYQIWRHFPPFTPLEVVGRVHAGVITYTDTYNPFMYPVVSYLLTASDGTNESEFSNNVKFHAQTDVVISLGCSVIEVFSEGVSPRILQAFQIRITEESSHAEITSVHERTLETSPTVTEDYAVPSIGNPGCLTDGSVEVCYSPSPGADAVVIDLGEECTVTSIMSDRVSIISSDASVRTNESIRALEAASVVELSLQIEVAGSDRIFYPFTTDSRSSTQAVRYIRICGASGLTEISVYGSRSTDNTVSSVEITRSAENEGWMFAIPVAERSEEAEIRIYDVSGRMIWSGYSESGSVLHWDGFTGNGTVVPNGVYLLQCSIGSQVSTGSFVVRRD